MNLLMHPRWFHHHYETEHQTGLDQWRQVLHHDVFWITIITLAVLVLTLALSFFLGGNPPHTVPYMGYP